MLSVVLYGSKVNRNKSLVQHRLIYLSYWFPSDLFTFEPSKNGAPTIFLG